MSFSTSGSFGCTGVFVMRCQKHVRSSTFWGIVVQGVAAVYARPWIVKLAGVIAGSELWTMFGSSYVPGTLALMGSPWPDVFMMMNCALSLEAHVGKVPSARARRGFSKNEAGRPVARARRPTRPDPNRVDKMALRRVIIVASLLIARS